ncbi:hypothetical protein D918_01371 [Trichuris suis]|nr:hypothetical protein D918_01371 [Trichuris suis]
MFYKVLSCVRERKALSTQNRLQCQASSQRAQRTFFHLKREKRLKARTTLLRPSLTFAYQRLLSKTLFDGSCLDFNVTTLEALNVGQVSAFQVVDTIAHNIPCLQSMRQTWKFEVFLSEMPFHIPHVCLKTQDLL